MNMVGKNSFKSFFRNSFCNSLRNSFMNSYISSYLFCLVYFFFQNSSKSSTRIFTKKIFNEFPQQFIQEFLKCFFSLKKCNPWRFLFRQLKSAFRKIYQFGTMPHCRTSQIQGILSHILKNKILKLVRSLRSKSGNFCELYQFSYK